jgi:cytochrome c oxidase subunit 4
MSQENIHVAHSEDHAGMSKSEIWKIFFILLGLTIVEFVIALAVPESMMSHPVKNFIYIALTLVKAYYIVAYFMHLKFEKYALIVAILVSFIFIIYFIILLLTEGNYIQQHMNL